MKSTFVIPSPTPSTSTPPQGGQPFLRPYNQRKKTLIGCLMLIPFLLSAQQRDEGDSPSGKIHFVLRGDDAKKIYLSGRGGSESEVELCETPGFGNLAIHFSPDDYWLVVQDSGSSLGVSLRLFRRDRGLRFLEQKGVDIGGRAEELALTQNGLSGRGILDHRYLEVLAWSRDSTLILICLNGHGGTAKQQVRIENWLGVYDLASGFRKNESASAGERVAIA
jgi:WD40 repeat protein